LGKYLVLYFYVPPAKKPDGERTLSKEIRMGKISPEQYEKYRQKLKQMRMMDDTLMKCVFKGNKPAVELVLRIILQRDDLEVLSFNISKEYKNLKGHSICLDVVASDKNGNQYNIEVQRDNRGANPKRLRIYSALMDTEMLDKGKDYSELKDNYVIFITENDIFKKGKPFYHFERINKETGEPLGDGSHIIYVNGAYTGNDPFGWLMSDFRETDPSKMHYDVLAERINFLKNNAKGEKEMCKIMEELVEEGIQKGIQITIKLYRQLGLSKEQIIEQLAAEYEIPQSEAAKYVYAE
jgi:hypothetical protein